MNKDREVIDFLPYTNSENIIIKVTVKDGLAYIYYRKDPTTVLSQIIIYIILPQS